MFRSPHLAGGIVVSSGGCGDRIVIALVNNNTVRIEMIEKSVLSYPWLGKRAI